MRFLVDEMFGADVARLLGEFGLSAVHVTDVGLGGASDADVLATAIAESRVLVTENVSDFGPLIAQRREGGEVTAVLIVLRLGRGVGQTLHESVAEAVVGWARENPEPYSDIHWTS